MEIVINVADSLPLSCHDIAAIAKVGIKHQSFNQSLPLYIPGYV